ncbi:uncharacterized protein LOC141536472 isoform X2 [Cotesia typhae]|uniref:uncharacterized protein LOC141536472 isoform X2 n=1 Tax=Cotesia typhae TaxID=2053667 RepID=UPI003D687927
MKIQRLNAATRQQFTGPLPLTQLGQRPPAPCPISDVTSRRRPRRSHSPRHSHSDSAVVVSLRSPTDLPTVASIGIEELNGVFNREECGGDADGDGDDCGGGGGGGKARRNQIEGEEMCGDL